MLEALIYGAALAGFGFVIMATARMPHDMMVVACMPAVFLAIIMGFIMAIYAGDTFGVAMPIGASVAGAAVGWRQARRFNPRDVLVMIYLIWAAALVLAAIGVRMPDAE